MKCFFSTLLFLMATACSSAQETSVKVKKIDQSESYYFIHGTINGNSNTEDILIISQKQTDCSLNQKQDAITVGKSYGFNLSDYVTDEDIEHIQASGSETFLFLEDYPIWSNRHRFLTMKALDVCDKYHMTK